MTALEHGLSSGRTCISESYTFSFNRYSINLFLYRGKKLALDCMCSSCEVLALKFRFRGDKMCVLEPKLSTVETNAPESMISSCGKHVLQCGICSGRKGASVIQWGQL